MKIRTKLVLSYGIVVVATLLIVSFVFDYSVSHHFDRVFAGELRGPGMNRFKQMSMPFISAVRYSLIYAALGAGLLVLVISYFVSNYLLAPVKDLIDITKNIAKGKYDQRVDNISDDELGDLANSLNKMAEKLEEIQLLRRELVANVSHELSTPLTSVRGYLEALHDGVIDKKKRKDTLLLLREEAERLVSMVEDVKRLAVVDQSTLKLNLEEVDLGLVVYSVTQKMAVQAEECGVNLEMEIEGSLPLIMADVSKLEQILINLLNNAIKFSDKGGEVDVELRKIDAGVVLEVKDKGVGISRRDLPYIFERFYRADKSRSRETGGTGIGLAIVKELVDAHGWEIDVKSEVGKGTCFKLLFLV